MIQTQRKNYVDYIKAIGIVLVILGHINFANGFIKSWIYAFHMPLFFFASGLIIKKEKFNWAFILKKLRGLIVPYFIWALIYSGYSVSNVIRIGYGSYQTISGAGSLTSLWFLPTMFISVILVQALFHITEKTIVVGMVMSGCFVISALLPIIRIGYPWCIDISILAAAFILFGYLIEKVSCRISLQNLIILCIIGFFFTFVYRINPVASDSYVLMASRRIGNALFFLIPALGGCLMVYSISRIFEKLSKLNSITSFITFIGRNTLVIFVVHKPIISIFGRIFTIVEMPRSLVLVVAGIGTLIGSCTLSLLINRFAPCLAGKSTSKEI